ncbi:MAG: hypothetical protein JWM02_3379 [Frankiales bacterium]|nr:hypothetical protein [Frankiales bacterium]
MPRVRPAVCDHGEEGIVIEGGPTPRASKRQLHGWKLALVALCGYLLAAGALTRSLWRDPLHSTVGGGGGDAALFLSFLTNSSTALWHDHGHGLLVTHALNAPQGINVMWNTGLLLPGLLLSSVTELAGPVLTLNLLLLLGPALSAWSAYLCSGRFLSRTSARVITGLVFGFSPALLSAELGHLQLTLLPLVPPLMLTAVDAATGRRGPLQSGALLGLLVAGQVLIGEEVLVLTCVAIAVVLITLAAQYPERVRERVLPLAVSAAVGVAVLLLLAGYPLLIQFFGPQAVHGEIQTPDIYVLDPVALFVPNSVPLLRNLPLLHQIPVLRLNNAEDMGYLGLPMLVLLAAVVWVRRHDVVARTAGIGAAVLGVIALGYTLHLAGGGKHLPLPWGLTSDLPVIGSLLPVRWMLIVDLLVALLVGVWVERLPTGRWPRTAGIGLLALALVPILPHQLGNISPVGTPAFFRSGAPGLRGTVLLVPMATVRNPVAMSWQAEAGMRFAMPGGYFVGPHRGGQAHFGVYPVRPTARLLVRLQTEGGSVLITPGVRRFAREDLKYWGAHTVALAPSPHERECRAFLTELLRRPPELNQDVWLWRHVDPSQI